MKNNYTHVVANFKEAGSTLVSLGKYEFAEGQLKTNKRPEFKQATKSTTLAKAFVEYCLERPKPPRGKIERWLRSDEGKMAKKWASYSDEQKVKLRLEEMSAGDGWVLVDFELL